MEDKILEFINRRFPHDSNWTTGNCYHFALILSNVFYGEIYYDVVNGHFVTLIDGEYYDYYGIVKDSIVLVKWSKFEEYDVLQRGAIIRDCVR